MKGLSCYRKKLNSMFIPFGVGFDHGVEGRQELSHTGDDRDFERFPSLPKPFVELLDR